MSSGPWTFKQGDLTRALKAACKAGLTVDRAWIEQDGKIVLGFVKPIEFGSAGGALEKRTKEIVL